ncbi:hypothetical protein GBF38_022326 [Nibea albiflora]|uniref:Uncharacterized protein n=1 Tax=Nibea albiflora TaxID=240163 RepID=A0ACB7FKR1_NIBAL|nr:hypothetical protein GBF38_022326 [Nibea albiflora]
MKYDAPSGRVPAVSLNVVALPPKKRKQKRAEGFKVTWRKRDRNGNIISQHVRKNRSACVLPIPLPLQVCTCGTDQDFTIVPGEQTVLVTINGPYNLCLPVVCCPRCDYKWTPGINDLLGCRYWPATTSCQLLFKFDVFTSFEEMKLASPALSQQAFLRMLEHRSLSTGRMGSICGDTFHRAFREFAFCNFKKDDLCQVEPFKCPACTPDMLAISADGNRKH